MAVQHGARSENQSPARPHRVLVAEDEHLVATTLQRDLIDLGYAVVGPAGSGAEALRLAESDGCDLALVDLHIPDIHGTEVARSLFESHCIPVIVVTAHIDEDYILASVATGVFSYLLKPVSRDQLRAAIPLAWARYRGQVELAAEVRDANHRLEERKLVERAKGLLMERLHISEPEAMRRLQRDARNHRQSMTQIAQAVIAGHSPLLRG